MSITLFGAGEMETNEIVVNAKYLKAFLTLFTALLFKKKITPNLAEFVCISFQYSYGYNPSLWNLELINQSGTDVI